MQEKPNARRALLAWAIGFGVLIAAFFVVIGVLGGTVYSAHGFVASYLDALGRHDATTARELPGVRAPDRAATNLLTDDALGTLSDIHLLHDTANAAGVHTVTYSYTLGKKPGTSSFTVEKTGAFLGLFPRWEFVKSPLATVSVSVLHDARFEVNGTEVTSPKQNVAASYVVFTPGLYTFDHRSLYLTATPVGVPVTEPGSVTPVQVDVEANATFVKEVRQQLDKYFTTCATQKVLLPTSCPFGKSFSNRVVSTPAWSIKSDPPITITPDSAASTWLVPSATGYAHLKVKVQSLYDGTVSTFDSDVPFQISYSITVAANNHLTITALY